jgi:hypothetical protein
MGVNRTAGRSVAELKNEVELAEAGAQMDGLKAARASGRLSGRVARLWLQSIRRRMAAVSGQELRGDYERKVLNER